MKTPDEGKDQDFEVTEQESSTYQRSKKEPFEKYDKTSNLDEDMANISKERVNNNVDLSKIGSSPEIESTINANKNPENRHNIILHMKAL